MIDNKDMKITIVGLGYVGLSLSSLLSINHEVVGVDIDLDKINKINNRISPIKDEYIELFFNTKKLNLVATDKKDSFIDSDLIIISLPTNYDEVSNKFDTSEVDKIVDEILSINSKATIVIKSTVPIGYTESLLNKYHIDNIIFSPEFLRESKALYDNLYPSRIIIGCKSSFKDKAKEFASILKEASLVKDVPILYMDVSEAETVKLFSNTFLALRITYFNELDSFAIKKGLDSKSIIDGVCLDPRIGEYYNNPSFGYGGYCLPKDTKQLKANFLDVPEKLISASVESNDTRIDFIVSEIIKRISLNDVIGVYRLTMKSNSDNFRESSIQKIANALINKGYVVKVHEPSLTTSTYQLINDLDEFKKVSSLIIANRVDDNLDDVKDKVYTRDLYRRD